MGEELDLTIFDPRGQFTGEIGRTAHEAGGQVGVLVHGKRSGAHAIARDGLRGRVPRRLARRNPLGDRIARREGIGAAREVGVALGAAGERGGGERPGEQRNLPAADALRRGLAREALAVVHGGDAQRESVRDQRAVQIEALPATAKAIEAKGETGYRASRVGLRGHEVYGAGAVADAEETRVGAAVDLDGVDVVEVERNFGVAGEVADSGIGAEGGIGVGARAGCAGAADAADAIGGLRIGRDVVLHAAGAVRVELREVPRALGVGLVEKHVVDIDRRRVDELLLRDDGDRRAEVLELRVEPGAGERVERLVTALVGDDLKRSELKGLFGG